MILIAVSNKDVASLNIAKQILNHYSFEKSLENFQGNPVYEAYVSSKEVKLITLNEESVYAQNITDFFPNPELIVFISRHSSVSGIPTLSVHTPGNLGREAKLGGIPRKVSVSPANAMRDALKAMKRLKDETHLEYDVSYECTHHGPSLDVPTMFTELGGSPKQWKDLKAAEVVAHATMEAVSKFNRSKVMAVLGIGGPHYNRKFTEIALKSETAFGHMIPKYAMQDIDEEIIRQCVEKTFEKVKLAILEWKGIKGGHKGKVLAILKDLGLSVEKV